MEDNAKISAYFLACEAISKYYFQNADLSVVDATILASISDDRN